MDGWLRTGRIDGRESRTILRGRSSRGLFRPGARNPLNSLIYLAVLFDMELMRRSPPLGIIHGPDFRFADRGGAEGWGRSTARRGGCLPFQAAGNLGGRSSGVALSHSCRALAAIIDSREALIVSRIGNNRLGAGVRPAAESFLRAV